MTDEVKVEPPIYMGAITKGAAFIMDYGQEGVEELVRIADVQPADDACCKVRVAGATFWQPEFEFRRRATPLAAHPAPAEDADWGEPLLPLSADRQNAPGRMSAELRRIAGNFGNPPKLRLPVFFRDCADEIDRLVAERDDALAAR